VDFRSSGTILLLAFGSGPLALFCLSLLSAVFHLFRSLQVSLFSSVASNLSCPSCLATHKTTMIAPFCCSFPFPLRPSAVILVDLSTECTKRNRTAQSASSAHGSSRIRFSLFRNIHISVREWSTLDQRKQSISILAFNSQANSINSDCSRKQGILEPGEHTFFGGEFEFGQYRRFRLRSHATYSNRSQT